MLSSQLIVYRRFEVHEVPVRGVDSSVEPMAHEAGDAVVVLIILSLPFVHIYLIICQTHLLVTRQRVALKCTK